MLALGQENNIIMTESLGLDPDAELSAEEQAISHLTASSIENYLVHTGTDK